MRNILTGKVAHFVKKRSKTDYFFFFTTFFEEVTGFAEGFFAVFVSSTTGFTISSNSTVKMRAE